MFVLRGLSVNPAQPGTLSAIGLVYQCMGHTSKAVEAYHSALALRPDDALTADMLTKALADDALLLGD